MDYNAIELNRNNFLHSKFDSHNCSHAFAFYSLLNTHQKPIHTKCMTFDVSSLIFDKCKQSTKLFHNVNDGK